MVRALTFAVGFAAGYAVRAGVAAGAGHQPSAQRDAVRGRSSRLPDAQQWSGTLSSSASTVADSARSAWRRAVATVGVTLRRTDTAAAGTPAPSGGVIPLGQVPVDQLSDWELDLLTTPDSSR